MIITNHSLSYKNVVAKIVSLFEVVLRTPNNFVLTFAFYFSPCVLCILHVCVSITRL